MNEDLVAQMETLQDSKTTISKSELERFKTIDIDNENMRNRIKSLLRQMDINLEILQVRSPISSSFYFINNDN